MKAYELLGRIVHYQAYGSPGGEYPSVPRAAIITEVVEMEELRVKLAVFNPSGIHWNTSPYSKEPKPGTWRWASDADQEI